MRALAYVSGSDEGGFGRGRAGRSENDDEEERSVSISHLVPGAKILSSQRGVEEALRTG